MSKRVKARMRVMALIVAAAAALGLAGCANTYTPTLRGVSIVTLEHDGRTIPCAVAEGGGIDCDWTVTE